MAHRLVVIGAVAALLVAGCSDASDTAQEAPAAAASAAPAPSPTPTVERLSLPQEPFAASLDGSLGEVTADLGRLGFERSAAVVVATDTLPGSLAAAVAAARAIPAPLVVGDLDDARALADDLDAERILAVGATADAVGTPSPAPSASMSPGPQPSEASGDAGTSVEVTTVTVSGRGETTVERLTAATGQDADAIELPAATDHRELRSSLEAQATDDAAIVLVDPGSLDPAGMAAAAAAVGALTVDVPDLALLGARGASERLAELGREPVATAASEPVADEVLEATRWVAEAAAAGHRILPELGWRLLPDVRLVGLYGHPQSSGLGVLGEQPVEAAVERAVEQAEAYDEFSQRPVVPMFEIIATVASGEAGPDGDRSRETQLEILEPWVDAAEAAGIYVVLDLQPGLSTFLEQAKRYEPLLKRPHVGLALDPEWRLDPCPPKCVHLRSIGSVSAEEVNEVSAWLADLVVEEALPQKLFLVHQFKLSMIRDRERIDTDIPQLAVTIQMDGQGPQGTKLDTWRTLHGQPDAERYFWGWKNFHDEDTPTRSPADTMALDPKPLFVTYQ